MYRKVASSEWKKLFLRLQGDPNWRDEPWWKLKNLTTLYKLEQRTYPGRAMEILTDASWTKGVFFRDPLRRLLSCYKDKFMNGTERSRKYSVKVFQADHILSFEDFLERITKPGAPMNVHWRPQVRRRSQQRYDLEARRHRFCRRRSRRRHCNHHK